MILKINDNIVTEWNRPMVSNFENKGTKLRNDLEILILSVSFEIRQNEIFTAIY
jgi:hypothetical protein